MKKAVKGFSLIELMITLLIVAVALTLAVPTYRDFVEKRQLTAAVEDISSYINLAQSMSIKTARPVNVSWQGATGHDGDFCMGMSSPPKAMACDCWEADPEASDFCSVGDSPYRLSKQDFVDVGHEFAHFRPGSGNFTFDPVRGSVASWSDQEVVDGDWILYVHSNEGTGPQRLFGLELSLGMTGRVSVCHQSDRKMRIGAYPPC